MTGTPAGRGGPRDDPRDDRGRQTTALTQAISSEIVALYATVYGHHRTTATTYINDNVVLCVLENILTEHETALIASGASCEVIDGRVAFQTDTEDEFTVAVERLTRRRVVAFMSANQTLPGVAAELFILDTAPLAATASVTR
ncbi:MAG: Na-translocating system protein MpsC family protein [Solirubrobacteraceae bacterium]|nr:Na-translocating system protein MpsC family protein [Solirubrobacteraceae bacterium]